jgi:hypothetical protein
MLAGDKNARLYQRLVTDEQLATQVDVQQFTGEIASQFAMIVRLASCGKALAPRWRLRVTDPALRRTQLSLAPLRI